MITTALLKEHLRISATNTDQDGVLAELETAAVGYIEAETNRYFGPEGEETWFVRGSGKARLWLPRLVQHGQTITVKERANPGDDATTITAGDDDGYLSDRPSSLTATHTQLLVRKKGHLWYRSYEYEVTATRGYAAGAEPADIRKLVLDIVTHWYQNREPTPKKGQVAVPHVPHHAQAVITRWRQRPWA